MRLIVDESADYYFIEEWKARHFTVTAIIKAFASASDDYNVSMLLMPPAVLITEDKDFGDLFLISS